MKQNKGVRFIQYSGSKLILGHGSLVQHEKSNYEDLASIFQVCNNTQYFRLAMWENTICGVNLPLDPVKLLGMNKNRH